METFRNISWNVPIDEEAVFATAEQFRSTSVTYKVLHGLFKTHLTSDSSDESVFEEIPKPKSAQKKKKVNKKKKEQSRQAKKKKAKSNVCNEVVVNEDGVRLSAFNAEQHASYVKILCTMQNQMSNVPPNWQEMKEAVEEEHVQFLEYIKELWKTAYEKHHILSEDARKYTEDVWKSQLKRVKLYPQFYKREAKIPLVYSADRPEVQMIPLKVLLEMGIVPKLYTPDSSICMKITTDFTKMMMLNIQTSADAHTLLGKPVSSDRNAEVLAVVENAHIVISSSSLKCIADNVAPKFDKTWNIPVIVKEYKVKDGRSSRTQKIVYIDKKLPAKYMSANERNSWFHKLAVKTFMCNHKDPRAFRYPESHNINPNVEFSEECEMALSQNSQKDTSLETSCKDCNLPIKLKKGKKNIEYDFTISNNSCDSDNLVIDEDSDCDRQTDTCTCDRSTQEINRVEKNTSINEDNSKDIIPPISKTNVTYRLWKLNCEERSREDLNEKFLKGNSSSRELRVLVRCKMDACEHECNNVIPVCISSKLEYQTEYGGEKVNLSSLVREWTSLFFRPEASLRRIRIDAVTEEVIMTEKLVLRDLTLMASQTHNIRIRRTVLGSLYQVMSDLVKLKPGRYLLSHDMRDGPFVCVFEEANEYSTFDLHGEYGCVHPEIVTRDEIPQWTSIDTNLITPIHIVNKQIPGTFQPCK